MIPKFFSRGRTIEMNLVRQAPLNPPTQPTCVITLLQTLEHTDAQIIHVQIISNKKLLLVLFLEIINMAELGEATVNRILHEKTTTEEEKIKRLLNSRHSIEIIDFLKNSSRPQEDYRVIITNLFT